MDNRALLLCLICRVIPKPLYNTSKKVRIYNMVSILNPSSEFVSVTQSKPMDGFSIKFSGCFPQEDLEVFRFWEVSDDNCCHGNAFKILGS